MSNKLLERPSKGLETIVVGARGSPLSRAQVKEVQMLLPHIRFTPHFVETTGDLDLDTSLRNLDKTDFFTREVDALLKEGLCRIAVHSAKDLPDPIPPGLHLIAVTKGIDPSDALVLRQEDTLETLPSGARIATSSERREAAVKALRTDLTFIDLRGKIAQRIAKLTTGEADGVVVAEAALIRLGLTHLNRVRLPGDTVPLQGKLAILCREGDSAMAALFAPLDARITTLYLGLAPPKNDPFRNYIHYPLIKTVPRSLKDFTTQAEELPGCTHYIFTSQSAVRIFFDLLQQLPIPKEQITSKTFLAVGKKTAAALACRDAAEIITPQEETAEGVIALLKSLPLENARLLWPHSALSRPAIADYLKQQGIPFAELILYDTFPHVPHFPPPLESVAEILFTSPSTVAAFADSFGPLPPGGPQLRAIGRVTAKALTVKKLQGRL